MMNRKADSAVGDTSRTSNGSMSINGGQGGSAGQQSADASLNGDHSFDSAAGDTSREDLLLQQLAESRAEAAVLRKDREQAALRNIAPPPAFVPSSQVYASALMQVTNPGSGARAGGGGDEAAAATAASTAAITGAIVSLAGQGKLDSERMALLTRCLDAQDKRDEVERMRVEMEAKKIAMIEGAKKEEADLMAKMGRELRRRLGPELVCQRTVGGRS